MPTPRLLLLIPPLTQLNTPYPSTAYLTGFLRGRGIETSQADLGIEMVLKIFSRSGLQAVFEQIRGCEDELPGEARQMLAVEPAYLHTIEPVIEFLQGRNPSLALLLARPGFLPQGPRFAGHRGRSASVHALSEQDRAKRFATLYLEDLADLIRATVSPHFALSRYAEHIARAASSFETIIEAVAVPPTLTDQFMLESLWAHLDHHKPSLVALTVPFRETSMARFVSPTRSSNDGPTSPLLLEAAMPTQSFAVCPIHACSTMSISSRSMTGNGPCCR